MITVRIKSSDRPEKRLTAIFYKDNRKYKKVHFGQKSGNTYVDHGDDIKKVNYIKRHRVRENWNDPYSAGALSRYILWNKKSLDESVRDYKKRFGFS